MSEENLHGQEAAGHGEHDELHLPPNSFVPISIALSLCMTFVGFVGSSFFGSITGGGAVFLPSPSGNGAGGEGTCFATTSSDTDITR